MPNSSKNCTVVGSGKVINGKIVTHCLTVVGNNNTIHVARNQGKIEVIGNQCRLNIRENKGDVVLVGNYGDIHISSCAKKESVMCTGVGCRVTFKGADEKCKFKMVKTWSSPALTHDLAYDWSKIIDLDHLIDFSGLEKLPS